MMSEKRKTVGFQDTTRFRNDDFAKPRQEENKKKTNQEPQLDRTLRRFENDGIKKIMSSKTNCGKLFWLLLIVAASIIAAYYIAKAVTDYYESPTITSYKIVSKKEMNFPQIYICPSMFVRKSYLQEHPEKVKEAREMGKYMFVKENAGKPSSNKSDNDDNNRSKRSVFDDDDGEEIYDSPLLMEKLRYKRDAGVQSNFSSLRNRIFNNTKLHTLVPNVATTTRAPPRNYPNGSSEFLNQTYMEMSIDQGDMFLTCTFRSFLAAIYQCKNITQAVLDPVYGKCWLMNINRLFNDNKTQQVPAQGLVMILNIKTQEYAESPKSLSPKFKGIMVSIAQKYDPSGYEQVLIPPNAYTKVDITAQHLKFLNVDSGPTIQLCNTPDDFPYQILDANYSQPSCYLDCHLRTVAKRCNCLMTMDHIFFKAGVMGNYSFCNLDQAKYCVTNNVTESDEAQKEVKACTDKCHIPCESWRYSTRVSSMPLNPGGFPKFPPNTTIEDFVYVHFAFPFLEYDEFVQDWSMTPTEMVGTIGGHIGLWLGASMLTLIQIPLMIFTLSGYHAYKKTIPIIQKVGRSLSRAPIK